MIANGLRPYLPKSEGFPRHELYATFPNPFYKSLTSALVETQPELYLVDGGDGNQNNPIWPFLQPARNVDILIVNDNSADTDDYFPNGTEILHTYVQAQAAGLTRMPFIPSVSEFVGKGLNKRAAFFGCDDSKKLTIVYLPNVNYTFPSGQSSAHFDNNKAEIDGLIDNGVQIALQNGDPEWPKCLGCAFMWKKAKDMPSKCGSCMRKYCYRS